MAVEAFYDGLADEYDRLRYGSDYHRRVARIELDFIQPYLRKGSCLEVGAGTGRVTRFLIDCAESVVAVDLSARMLERLQCAIGPNSNLSTKTMDIYDLDQIDGYGQFSNVVCFRLLPHLKELSEALRLLRGAVMGDGMILFDLWNSWGYNAVMKRVGLRKGAIDTNYLSIRQMYATVAASELSIVDRKGVGFPPLRPFLPLEKSSLRAFDWAAQRILWICKPL